jgi:polyhydroxyalkanoate synthesis regulator phasin
MTANELADELDECSCVYYDSTTNQYFDDVELSSKAADMLRQQAKEIEQLNFVLKNLTLATNKKINELEEEIENLKSKVQYWKGLHK